MGKDKTKKYVATILPLSGEPFDEIVEEDKDGVVEHEGKTWAIAPGSVFRGHDKKRRVILPESMSNSLSATQVSGKTYMNASMFVKFYKLQLLKQLFDIQDKKPWYKQSGVWIIAGSILLLALVGAWIASSVAGGLEEMAHAIEALKNHLETSGGGSRTGSGNETHNDIAPRRR